MLCFWVLPFCASPYHAGSQHNKEIFELLKCDLHCRHCSVLKGSPEAECMSVDLSSASDSPLRKHSVFRITDTAADHALTLSAAILHKSILRWEASTTRRALELLKCSQASHEQSSDLHCRHCSALKGSPEAERVSFDLSSASESPSRRHSVFVITDTAADHALCLSSSILYMSIPC